MKTLLLPALAAMLTINVCASADDSVAASPSDEVSEADTVALAADTIIRLTDDDYRAVAEELGVEIAAIKAVVDIEAGRSHQGFSAPGKPLINFDLSMFRRFAGKRGINLSKYHRTHSTVFNTRRRLSQGVQNERLAAALSIDRNTAIEGTFWGMFQIGGFNWKKCGAGSIDEFVELMSRSERDQLNLFGNFIKNSGLLPHLRNKNWSAFARGYNGPSYARRGYHTRLAKSYATHKRNEKADSAESAESSEASGSDRK